MADLSDVRTYLLVNSGNIFDKELESDDWLMQVVKKSLIFYNNYMPNFKDKIISILGGDLLSSGGQAHQFDSPFPKVVSCFPLAVGTNFFDGLATYQSHYDPSIGELRVNSTGFYRIKYAIDLTLEDITQEEHPIFYLVLEAQYKIVLGGMRKRFTISDSQFSVDTGLESEGKADLDEAKKILQDNAPFWQGLGGR
jgi:hypothetical protein